MPAPLQEYPLFTAVNAIVNGRLPPTFIVKYGEAARNVRALEDAVPVVIPAAPAGKKKLAALSTDFMS